MLGQSVGRHRRAEKRKKTTNLRLLPQEIRILNDLFEHDVPFRGLADERDDLRGRRAQAAAVNARLEGAAGGGGGEGGGGVEVEGHDA